MGSRALVSALLCVCCLTACGGDANPSPPTDGLSATFRWNGTLALREPLRPGEQPPPGSDCAAALRWAIDTHHAEPFEDGNLTVEVTTNRVLQVNQSWVGVHEVRQYHEDGWDYEFGCPHQPPPSTVPNWRTFTLGDDTCTAPMRCRAEFEDNSGLSELTMPPGQPRAVELTVDKTGTWDFEYVVDFDAEVNGLHVSRPLNSHGQTLRIHDWPYRQGARPATYTWAPGTPGSLTFTPAITA